MMGPDGFEEDSAMFPKIIPAKIFYAYYDPNQQKKVDQEFLDQLENVNFQEFIETAKEFLQINNIRAYNFYALMRELHIEIEEDSEQHFITTLRWMVIQGMINGNYIKGRFYHCFPQNMI